MGEPASAQLLTEENLGRLRAVQREATPSESLVSSDFWPIDKLGREKHRVYNFLFNLRDIGAEGDRIREEEDIYIAGPEDVRYRGNAVPEPDLQDPSYWENKLELLKQKHGASIKLAHAKGDVCHMMTLLRNFGRDGRKILADYELYFAEKNDVRYRGTGSPEPDLRDPAYWNTQYKYLRSKYQPLWLARFPPPPALEEKQGEPRKLVGDDSSTDGLWAWSKRKREIRAWTNAEPAGSGEPGPVLDDVPERTTAANNEDSCSYRSAQGPYFRWHEAYRGVYERMAALWNIGGKGRDIVKNDELRIIGRYDVRFRRSRGPKPNLEDPRYWEAKWEYFTEEYISLLRDTQDGDRVLSELTTDPSTIPVPSPEPHDLSPVPSRNAGPRLRPEAIQAEQVKAERRVLYKILSLEFFKKEGRRLVEDDDIYVAGKYDVRYRRGIGPMPNLKDPNFWANKAAYFYNHYLSSLPEEERSTTQLLLAPASESTWLSRQRFDRIAFFTRDEVSPRIARHISEQPPAPTTIPLEHQTVAAPDPTDKENCSPGPAAASTQAMGLQTSPKRKRDDRLDDTDQIEGRPARAAKRRKPETGQSSGIPSVATESPAGAAPSSKTPTRDTAASQRPISGTALGTAAGQSPGAPEVIEELPETTVRTSPQPRKWQRKTYEKKRTSRRLAGQSPEFGLLPKRGQEPEPYAASSRGARATSKANSSAPRSGRISKKPTAPKNTKSRATTEPAKGRKGRQKRSKRN